MFPHTVLLLVRMITSSHGLCLHRTAQHRKTRANIHAPSGILIHDPNIEAAKTNALDRADPVSSFIKRETEHENTVICTTDVV
jgi:hypothetical protein